MHPGPSPGLLGIDDNLAGKRVKRLTAAFVRCNKEAWQMSTNTSTALFTFPKDRGGLQIKLPRATLCSATWGHLTWCCQFDDGTRQLAEITYKDALEQHGCLDMEDFQFEAEFFNMGPGESELIHICMSLNNHNRNSG